MKTLYRAFCSCNHWRYKDVDEQTIFLKHFTLRMRGNAYAHFWPILGVFQSPQSLFITCFLNRNCLFSH
ncbi:hypothetical protein OA04_09880 [Pectobacterium versatile]|nr:hypothetical protein OA04_09880 [Pectobacterium versatile]